MTTEQQPPVPPEHRGPPWLFDGFSSRARRKRARRRRRWRLVLVPVESPEHAVSPPAEAPTEVAAPPETEPVIDGEVVSDADRAARERTQEQERAATEHLPVSPYYQQQLRLQLADHTEREHQMRLARKGQKKAMEPLGPGGGITAKVVQAMSEAIAEKRLPAPDGSPEEKELLLFGALAAAGLNQAEGRVSFVTQRGRLMLDVSTADQDEPEPSVRLVRLSSRSDRADEDTAEHDSAAVQEDEEPGRYAAVICGSAAFIARGRAFLSMDALTEFARNKAFHANDLADPRVARRSMRAAHRIEIVVLLDVSLGGGVWVDVDPKTGRPTATLSIDLKPAGFQFTPLAVA
jgi:hypothetical protein